MIIDNSDLVRKLLMFPETSSDGSLKGLPSCERQDCFYVVQLIQRKKDNPARLFMNKNFRNNSNRTVQQFQIYSHDDFDMKLPVIVEFAKACQARAYIDLNIRNSKDVFARLMKGMSDRVMTGNYRHLHRLFNEAVGETATMKGTRRSWIVDVDSKDRRLIDGIGRTIASLRGGGMDGKGEVLAEIQTKNGVHLISSSFELDRFRLEYPDVDVHKRNPTILWMETDWSVHE